MVASGARLTVDLDALAHNHAVICAEASGAEVAPVLKADAYGLGAGPVARRLWAEGARSFFVARLAEGEALRATLTPGRPATIYVLDGLTEDAAPRLAAAGLTPVLNTLPQVTAATSVAGVAGQPLTVALHVDTGMNRQGLTTDECRALAQSTDRLRGLDVGLIMSHLGSAAEPENPRNSSQLAAFLDVRARFPDARASLSASAGAFLGPDYRYDMVRAGISLYGGGPEERPDPRLKAVATLTAPILDIRDLQPGDRVGYGTMFAADRPMRIAVVGAGYADGFLRAAAGKASVWCAGAPRRVLTVNMDLMTVDLGTSEASAGDTVELLGPNAALDDLALASKTVAHEVLVRLSARAERVYTRDV